MVVRIYPYAVQIDGVEGYQIRAELGLANGTVYTSICLMNFDDKEEFEMACLELEVSNECNVSVGNQLFTEGNQGMRDIFDLKIMTLSGYRIKGDIANAGMQMTYIFGWIQGLRDAGVIDNEIMAKWIDEVNEVDNKPLYTKRKAYSV